MEEFKYKKILKLIWQDKIYEMHIDAFSGYLVEYSKEKDVIMHIDSITDEIKPIRFYLRTSLLEIKDLDAGHSYLKDLFGEGNCSFCYIFPEDKDKVNSESYFIQVVDSVRKAGFSIKVSNKEAAISFY
jgi:hypothetical protein